MRSKINKITVETAAEHEALTKEILIKHSGAAVEFVDRIKPSKMANKHSELLVAKQRGSFIKKCPGTPKHLCCDYYVLNLGVGCFYDCTYCFLHHYMNTPFIVYANIDDLITEVSEFCAAKPDKTIRLGSGEFIDSVGFNEIVDLNKILVPALSAIPNLLFEIKTKSGNIEGLLGLEHNKRVVISWSVNPQKIIDTEETFANSLENRLEAAQKCQQAGYKIGFHFDPMIHYSHWQADYRQVADLIFEHVDPQNIAWISLGTLRFNPGLKPIMQKKFPKSNLVYGELITGLDGKMRYFMGIRKTMFKSIIEHIRSYSRSVPVYLCMENKSLADDVGAAPYFTLNNG